MEDMTEKELITVLIDKYTDLQRIKRANNGVENQELEYQIKVTIAKLASLGVSVEDITLSQKKNGACSMTFFWKSIMPEAWRRLEKDV